MPNLKRVLSIDGGGIRGIIPGQFLVEVEKTFNIKVSDYFDLVAGTSTGGILACTYLLPDDQNPGQPKFSAEEVVGLYFKKGGEIFDIPTFHKIRTIAGILDEKYPEKGIESALQEYIGETWLKDLLKPCLVTTYDIENRKGHFFGQHKALKDPAYNFKVKDVARSTSAAPTYFECNRVTSETGEQFSLIDGGVFVNNPALAAYAECRTLFTDDNQQPVRAKDLKILSIGTGHSEKPYPYKKAKNYGLAQWVQPIIDIMLSGGADVADYQLRQIFDTVDDPNQYLRLDGDIDSENTGIDSDIDCATPENMDKLREFGQALFQKNKDKVEQWLNL